MSGRRHRRGPTPKKGTRRAAGYAPRPPFFLEGEHLPMCNDVDCFCDDGLVVVNVRDEGEECPHCVAAGIRVEPDGSITRI